MKIWRVLILEEQENLKVLFEEIRKNNKINQFLEIKYFMLM
jgi:hypothetical protein